MGWRAQPTAQVQLDECPVPADSLLGVEGDGTRDEAEVNATWSLVVLLRRKRRDDRVVLLDHAHLGRATG